MKKLYFLMLLCSAMGFAQPEINENPTPMSQCTENGYGTFDLTAVIPEVLGALDESEHLVTFHQTLSAAQAGTNEISEPATFQASTAIQTIYVRVVALSDTSLYAIAMLSVASYPNPAATLSAGQQTVCAGSSASFTLTADNAFLPITFSYTINGEPHTFTSSSQTSATISLPTSEPISYEIHLTSVEAGGGCYTALDQTVTVDVTSPAIAYPVSDLVVYESPNDGYATFDLSSQTIAVSGGAPGVTVTYYATEADAMAQTAAILAVETFQNTYNPQTIWVRVQSVASQCASITSFDVVVSDPGIVYIPDPNFKNALLTAGYDTDADGNIQFAEAAMVTTLNIDNLNIQDLTGIKSFTNLLHLYAMDNLLETVDVSGMGSLRLAYFGGNNLEAINLNGLSGLEDLVLDQNELSVLTLENLPNLDRFSVLYNNLTGIFMSNLPQLREANLIGNELPNLDVSAFPSLEILSCANNNIAELNVIGATSLKTLDFSANLVTEVNVSGLSNLQTLYFDENPVQTHSWNGLSSLKYLSFSETGISEVDLAPTPALLTLQCRANAISSLDVSIFPSLVNLDCADNQITSLDLNQNTLLQNVLLYGNGMEMLFAKNGADETFDSLDFTDNNFVYICADESQIAQLQAAAPSGVEVNSYCSFTPGGPYNTVSGSARFDLSGDGCDASDAAQPFIKLHIFDGVEGVDVFTDNQAVYNFYVGEGDYTVNPVFENDYFSVSPVDASVDFPLVDGSVSTHDFCISANGVKPDAEVAVFPVVPARPGLPATYTVTIRNKGNQVLGQTYGLTLSYDESRMDFTGASVNPATAGSGMLTWNYSDLRPFESRSIELSFDINAPTDTPAVNTGDLLTLSATLSAAGDVLPADNTFAFEQAVVASFEPNNKVCLQGAIASPVLIGDYLHYAINFENTGNSTAENIVVKDVIDPTMYDRNSLVIMGSSHHVIAKSGGDGTIFIFQSINLDSGGHGNILLKVKTLGDMHEGDMVSNKADIYFDYSSPVITEPAETVFQSLGVNEPKDFSVSVFPNPASEYFTVSADSKILSIQLFDIQGRVIQAQATSGNSAKMDISRRQTGVYFAKITTESGVKTEKIIKQ